MSERPVDPPALETGMVVALVAVAAWAVVLAAGAGLYTGWGAAVGAALGGLAATSNLLVFALVGRGLLHGGQRGRRWGAVAVLKLLALLGGGYAVLTSGLVPVLAVALGYGALPLGITVASFLQPRGDDPHDPAGQPGGDPRRDLVTAAPTQRQTD